MKGNVWKWCLDHWHPELGSGWQEGSERWERLDRFRERPACTEAAARRFVEQQPQELSLGLPQQQPPRQHQQQHRVPRLLPPPAPFQVRTGRWKSAGSTRGVQTRSGDRPDRWSTHPPVGGSGASVPQPFPPFPHPAQISASSSSSPGNTVPASSRSAASILRLLPAGPHSSTACSSGKSSHPRLAPLA